MITPMQLSPRKVVLFTAGYHARAACRHLRRRDDWRVVAFVDNNRALQGTTLLGLPVLHPEALRTLDFDVVAVPGRHQREIAAQLDADFGLAGEQVWLVRKSEVPPAPDELERRGRDLASLLRRTLAVLDLAGVGYWAMHSTLLGLIRGDDLARFSDLDLCVDARAFDALEALFQPGYDLRAVNHRPADLHTAEGPRSRRAQLSLRSVPSVAGDEPAIVDLHAMTLGPTEASWVCDAGTIRLPAAHFRRFTTGEYRGITVRLPADAESILVRLYGDGWRTPAESWNGRCPDAPRPAATAVAVA